VPNKNLKPFFKNKSLLELKIESLLNVRTIDNIVINTDSDQAIELAKFYGIEYHRRETYFASAECKGSELFKHLAETTDSDIILYTPCTSPFIKTETYYSIINQFSLTTDHDSINTVTHVKDFLWLNNSPLNYKTESAPNSQDLPDIQKLTFGVNIIRKHDMIQNKNIVGKHPSFYVVDDIESIDIDTMLDFEFAQYMYKKSM
jgi:N-acylneuraminate cytidylyltransferase